MGLHEVIAEFKANRLVAREIPGYGTFQFRRLTAGEVLGFPDGGTFSVQLVKAATRDAEGQPVFASDKEVEELQFGTFRALLAACRDVNKL